ncbi:MAG: thrombospondin type 3 repeat-containing protein [Candidatus Schekmanbacteria bacterium]|nr:thrombospondin type 3 repeat-containing protein [Candidatus Schekmanbacteria bacterium]
MGNNAAPECLAAFSRALRRSLAQGMGQPDPYRDTDADGVPDEWDRCPNEPVDARSGQADEVLGALNPVLQDVILERDSPSYGCRTDSDHDGVPDARDLCPRTDPQAGAVDSDGCNAADRQDVLDPVSARVRRQG